MSPNTMARNLDDHFRGEVGACPGEFPILGINPHAPTLGLECQAGVDRSPASKDPGPVRPCCSHNQPGEEIPESSWAYRFAKKHWFFGFGAYG